jgi:hypothetical protein
VDNEVFELRNYKVDPARRQEFIDHFERRLIHTQEAEGIAILGQFEVVGEPDRFVWIRGFPNMRSRAASLSAFFGGKAWAEHGQLANDIMEQWDDVYLLRPTPSSPPIAPRYRPNVGGPPSLREVGSSCVLVLVSVFEGACDELPNDFAVRWINHLRSAGCSEIARFVAEPTENDFLRLPVKQEEGTVVVLAEAPSHDHARRLLGFIRDLESAGSRALLLRPTPRSFLPEHQAR